MNQLSKQPAETYPIALDFSGTGKLPSGASVSSCTAAAIDLYDQSDATSTVISSPTASVSANVATIVVRAGTSGRQYKITFTATLSDSSVLEDEVIMTVQEL